MKASALHWHDLEGVHAKIFFQFMRVDGQGAIIDALFCQVSLEVDMVLLCLHHGRHQVLNLDRLSLEELILWSRSIRISILPRAHLHFHGRIDALIPHYYTLLVIRR